MGKFTNVILSLVVIYVLAVTMSSVSGEPQEQTKASFEVISIKQGPTNAQDIDYKFVPGGRFKAVHVTLAFLISRAYEIDLRRVVNIPQSIEKVRWDIEARPEEGKYPLKNGLLDSNLANQMVQSMLEDRFRLKVHRDTRVLPGYELVIGKGGPKIKPSSKETKARVMGPIMPGYIDAHSVPLSDFASVLCTHLELWEGEKSRNQVTNKTGLEGPYDIRLRWTPARMPMGFRNKKATDPEISIFDAIQDQLGLKLVPAKIPASVLVVDEAQSPVTN